MRALFLMTMLMPGLCFAAGFDAISLWSAKYTGMGGAAISHVEGAQSLYFNPAGLSGSKNFEFDFNLNSGFVRKSAPVTPESSPTDGGKREDTPLISTPVLGIFSSHQINKRLGIGAGVYVAGGSGGKYEDVNFGADFPTIRPNIESAIFLLEFALGAGYQLSPNLSVGFAWRPSYVSLNSQGAAPVDLNQDGNPDILLSPELEDLSDLILGGFRLGLQYKPDSKKWGLGLMFRSENSFSAEGKTSGSSQLTGDTTISSINGGDVTAKSKIPMQLSLGYHYDTNPQWRLVTQYDYIRNERVKQLALSGDPLSVTGVGDIPVSNFSVPFEWKNQHIFRFGTEYRLSVWTLRAGYAHGTIVTPEDRATPVGSTPGSERAYAIGGGRGIKLFETPMQLDLALEHIRSVGEGEDSKPGSLDGTYKSYAYGFFAALSYKI